MTTGDAPMLGDVLKRLLTAERCEQLNLDGYLVLDDNPLPNEMASEFLREIQHCFHDIDGAKAPNQVEFLTSEGSITLTKPHIYECDLHQAAIREKLPLFQDLFDHQLGSLVELLRDRVDYCEDLVPFEDARTAAQAITLKLQMNEGGAFPWHYDNPSRPNKRRLTMAVYLTPDWTPEMGGELQLMPFLGPCVTVPPSFNTVAFFRSDLTLHKVLPVRSGAHKTRYCFTVWFDGSLTNSDEDQFLKTTHLQESAIPFLKRSPVQRILSRAVYAEEFRAGLEDCFGKDSVAYKVSLQEHNARLSQLLNNAQVQRFVQLLQLYREDKQEPAADGTKT